MMSMGLSPAVAAQFVSLAAVIAVFVGIFVLLRRANVPPSLATAGAGLVLGSIPAQLGITLGRSDLPASAFTVWALAAIIDSCHPRGTWMAALLFALAFLAKPTSVYAPLGVIISLALRRDRRVWLTSISIASALAASAVCTVLVSKERCVDAFRACVLGGTTIYDIASSAPVRFVKGTFGLDLILIAIPCSIVVSSRLRRMRGRVSDAEERMLSRPNAPASLMFATLAVCVVETVAMGWISRTFARQLLSDGGSPVR